MHYREIVVWMRKNLLYPSYEPLFSRDLWGVLLWDFCLTKTCTIGKLLFGWGKISFTLVMSPCFQGICGGFYFEISVWQKHAPLKYFLFGWGKISFTLVMSPCFQGICGGFYFEISVWQTWTSFSWLIWRSQSFASFFGDYLLLYWCLYHSF